MKSLATLIALLSAGAHAAMPGEVVRVISASEVVVRGQAGLHTLNFAHLRIAPGCHARWSDAWAKRTLQPGTPVQWVQDDLGQYKLYFDHAAYPAEWTEVALSFGAVSLKKRGLDHTLNEAEDRARANRAGLFAQCKEEDVFERVASESGVGRNLLLAIALTESGRGRAPWPWTLNVEGQGKYYPNREDAHTALVGYLKQGIRSIDVGPMQVNLKYHSHRFSNTWDALDPYKNVTAGAAILKENYSRDGNLEKAIGNYHSHTPWRANRYFERVSGAYRLASKGSSHKEGSP